jgi:hypothetical protein
MCSANLPRIQYQPEVQVLYRGILNFMKSEGFNPGTALTGEDLERFFC